MANGKRGRRTNKERFGQESIRLRFGDGNIVLGRDPQMDALYERIQNLPRGTKFKTVATWLLTGAMMESALPEGEVEQMKQAAADIIAAFVVE